MKNNFQMKNVVRRCNINHLVWLPSDKWILKRNNWNLWALNSAQFSNSKYWLLKWFLHIWCIFSFSHLRSEVECIWTNVWIGLEPVLPMLRELNVQKCSSGGFFVEKKCEGISLNFLLKKYTISNIFLTSSQNCSFYSNHRKINKWWQPSREEDDRSIANPPLCPHLLQNAKYPHACPLFVGI